MAPPIKYYTLSLPHTITQSDIGKSFLIQFGSAHAGKVIAITSPPLVNPNPPNPNPIKLDGLPLLLSQG